MRDQPNAETCTHNIHKREPSMLPGGIRTRNPSKQEAADPCLRPRSHRNRQKNNNTALIWSSYLEVRLVKCEVYIYCWKKNTLPVHAMREYRGCRVIAPLVILSLGARWRWTVKFMPRPLYPPGAKIPVHIVNCKLREPWKHSGTVLGNKTLCSCWDSKPGPSRPYPVDL